MIYFTRFAGFFIIVLSMYFYAQSKVIIFTYAYNQPEFIELQHKTFQKFLKDDYEFIVFSDAKAEKMHTQIKQVCNKYDLKCIRIPQEIHDRPYLDRPVNVPFVSEFHAPSVRNCNVVQYYFYILCFDHDAILVLIDSDLILITGWPLSSELK